MHRKKKQSHQPYIVGALIILLTFSLAFVLIYASSLDAFPVEGTILPPSSSDKHSNGNSSNIISEKPPSDKDETLPSDVPSPPNGITMEFTPEEIAQIEGLIKAAENSQASATSDSNSSSGASSDTSSGNRIAVPSNVSIYFKDVDSGYVYQNNEDYKYFIASLIKAPYCMYLYTMAEQGKCDLDEILTIEYKNIQIGTGKIKDKKPEDFPLEMSVRELMSFAIRYSDNTAMETLRKKYSHVDYLTYAKSLGLHYPEDVAYMVNGKITARDAGVYLNAINDYIKNGKYGSELEEDMSNTANRMIRSKHPIVRKYGWAELSFHDMAIVNAPHPYLLIILSDKGLGNKADYKLLGDISLLIEKFQAKRYE